MGKRYSTECKSQVVKALLTGGKSTGQVTKAYGMALATTSDRLLGQVGPNDLRRAVQTVYHDCERSSHVTLPVILR